ncbi:MAG TPA: twin-arginine translocation signal domain-containing protein [Burkholderiales bacterium]|nr:twin-arginine translocation signal domain-containing protein [Burkholderiales bacterium]
MARLKIPAGGRLPFELDRRQALAAAGALGAAALTGAAWHLWPEQGFSNPCEGALPDALAGHELVRAAWEGLDPSQCWDSHVHLAGMGDSDSGIVVNPRMTSLAHPVEFAQRRFFLNAGCATGGDGVDKAYVARLRALAEGMRPGFKLLLLPFECNVGENGEVSWERTSFHVPNRWAAQVAYRDVIRFEWAASIHPYRRDAVERLHAAVAGGARAVKWLPAAMGIDPASPICDPFYYALARAKMPLISHAGMEMAVDVESDAFGNPLRLRRALEHGVRVVVAHCASAGNDVDLDRGTNGPVVPSFELFARMMDDPRWEGTLFADISTLTQINRVGPPLARVLERSEWHPRLLNGSDYPLPGVMPLYSLDRLVELGFLEPSAAPVLSAIRAHNALLFDFVLKRSLRRQGKRFADGVFRTRAFFEPPLERPLRAGQHRA